MNKCYCLKFAALLLICLALFACKPEEEKYGTIYGTVTDYSSGNLINNANVRLNPRGETTLTGSDGRFQFNDLAAGSYSLSLSKNGYVDLDDDYVIRIENGNSVSRDVQMQKELSSLKIVDNDGNPVSVLDFGIEEGVNQKTFSIFNDGNMTLEFTITEVSNWIDKVVPSEGTVSIGDTKPIYVIINRESLQDGENHSNLLITTPGAGGAELAVKAIKPVLPTVVTDEITNVTQNSAKCSGNVTTDGGMEVTQKGVCYSKSQNPTIDDFHVVGGTGVGSFTCFITSLDENNTYYVRSYAINSAGTAYGVQKSFTTTSIPIVNTGDVTGVTSHSANCTGSVTSDGGSAVTSRGVCWSTAHNPTINSSCAISGAGTGAFSCDMENLQNNTTYFVRAFAKNSVGVSYGDEIPFTTELLPTFQYGGHTYQVAPDPGNNMEWSVASSYCNNLSVYGLTGWKMPEMGELIQMYYERNSIGGFGTHGYWSSTSCDHPIYSNPYNVVYFDNGRMECECSSYFRVRPIRRKD